MIYSIPAPSPFAAKDVSKANVLGLIIVPARFFKLEFRKFIQIFRTLNVFGKFLLKMFDQLNISSWLRT